MINRILGKNEEIAKIETPTFKNVFGRPGYPLQIGKTIFSIKNLHDRFVFGAPYTPIQYTYITFQEEHWYSSKDQSYKVGYQESSFS